MLLLQFICSSLRIETDIVKITIAFNSLFMRFMFERQLGAVENIALSTLFS